MTENPKIEFYIDDNDHVSNTDVDVGSGTVGAKEREAKTKPVIKKGHQIKMIKKKINTINKLNTQSLFFMIDTKGNIFFFAKKNNEGEWMILHFEESTKIWISVTDEQLCTMLDSTMAGKNDADPEFVHAFSVGNNDSPTHPTFYCIAFVEQMLSAWTAKSDARYPHCMFYNSGKCYPFDPQDGFFSNKKIDDEFDLRLNAMIEYHESGRGHTSRHHGRGGTGPSHHGRGGTGPSHRGRGGTGPSHHGRGGTGPSHHGRGGTGEYNDQYPSHADDNTQNNHNQQTEIELLKMKIRLLELENKAHDCGDRGGRGGRSSRR